MPGYTKISRSDTQKPDLFDKYQCHYCKYLLKRAVQPICGHWLCESCANELFSMSSPKCPRPDCGEDLKSDIEDDQEAHYFPDRFVRREIEGMVVRCPHQPKGCCWEEKLANLDKHLESCQFTSKECPQCGLTLTPDQVKAHIRICPKALVKCPLADLGCEYTQTMSREDLKRHCQDHSVQHLQIIALNLKSTENNAEQNSAKRNFPLRELVDFVERDGVSENDQKHAVVRDGDYHREMSETHTLDEINGKKLKYRAVVPEIDQGYQSMGRRLPDDEQLRAKASLNDPSILAELRFKLESTLKTEIQRKDEEIESLQGKVTSLEKAMRSKHAEFEDRDFRLSLIENSNYDGSMIWKIPQFSQRMADAQSGRYTSIFSLPFYTGRYGYKMCLRLYILGDGIGKNTHMSLFFVIMKGEFDNILQWPFTHKVTFKLINQTGGRDIIDTFQPDPMSSSFRKPKSDMNIASGCPRFVSRTDLHNNGFIVDDTVFIKCAIDCSSVEHP